MFILWRLDSKDMDVNDIMSCDSRKSGEIKDGDHGGSQMFSFCFVMVTNSGKLVMVTKRM